MCQEIANDMFQPFLRFNVGARNVIAVTTQYL